ncbi:ABC transporter permease [Clostridium sp.]|uniref:ABC transporter permease n=1 Tax=Clostridium sp. TaxID=1506 RepID=UPI002FC81ADB
MERIRENIKVYMVFFIIAFTLGILAFSIGNSAIINKNKNIERNSIKKNKSIMFTETKEANLDEVLSILEKFKLTVCLVSDNLKDIYATKTIVDFDGTNLTDDMSSGNYFTKEEFVNSSKNEGVFSGVLTDENKFTIEYSENDGAKNIDISKKGQSFQIYSEVIIPQKLFFKLFSEKDLSKANYYITIHGDENEISKAISEINDFVKAKDSTNKIEVNPYVMTTNGEEAQFLYKLSFLIIIITIINSISISYLWISDKKEELVLRKVCGAKNKDLFKMFFFELTILALFAALIAIIIQFIMVQISGGMIGTIDIRLNIKSIIYSAGIAIISAYLATIPIYVKIKKLEIVAMLKEE